MFAGATDAKYIATTYSSENQKGLPGHLQIHRGAQEEPSAERERALQVGKYKSKIKRDVIPFRSIIIISQLFTFQRSMRGDARRCQHPIRGRGELLRVDRNVADTETRGDAERSVRQFRRGVRAAQRIKN